MLTLGIDAGGTKTAAAIVRDGVEIGRGLAGPCSLTAASDAEVSAAIRESARHAQRAAKLDNLEPLDAVCLAIAGYSVAARHEVALGPLRDVCAGAVLLAPDYRAAFFGAAGAPPGMAVIAGTGAVAFGISSAGDEMRADGGGWLLGDRGSGFWLGAEALRAALAAIDTGDHTDLARALMAHVGADSADALRSWAYTDFAPARIAHLARFVAELAARGNSDACRLWRRAGAEMAATAAGLWNRLALRNGDPMYLLGGLWSACPLLRSEFVATLESEQSPARAIGAVFPAPRGDAALGAALLAVVAADGGGRASGGTGGCPA